MGAFASEGTHERHTHRGRLQRQQAQALRDQLLQLRERRSQLTHAAVAMVRILPRHAGVLVLLQELRVGSGDGCQARLVHGLGAGQAQQLGPLGAQLRGLVEVCHVLQHCEGGVVLQLVERGRVGRGLAVPGQRVVEHPV